MIRTKPHPGCHVCGSQGELLYQGLKDRVYSAPGEWNLKKCSNPECGLLWLDPMPIEKDIGKAYQDYYTHQDAELPNGWLYRSYEFLRTGYWVSRYGHNGSYGGRSIGTWNKLLGLLLYLDPTRTAKLDSDVMFLQAQPGNRLLDVGCGGGDKLKIMQDLGWQVEGVDSDSDAVRNARSKGFQVRLGTLEDQAYPNDRFDAIIMSHVIEHVHDPHHLSRECQRILKTGGTLVIITPNSKSHGHVSFGESWSQLDPPRHLYIFSPQSLRRLVEASEFHVIEVSTNIVGADWIFKSSQSIRDSGRWTMDNNYSLRLSLQAKGMQLAEWARLAVNPNIGENLTILAKK